MARLPRVVLPGYLHLVVHTAQRGRTVFTGISDRQRYLEALHDAARETNVLVHAYGLPDHEVRILATPTTLTGLATLVQSVGRRYVRHLNRTQGSTGTPWEGRFRSAVVDPTTHFRDCLRFVELDRPLDRAALPTAEQSSVRHHLGLEQRPLISEHAAFWEFGNTPFEREAAYARFAEQGQMPEVATFLREALRGWVVGVPSFAVMVTERSGRRATKQPSGRPRRMI